MATLADDESTLAPYLAALINAVEGTVVRRG
jgi:hypothetical protein